MATLGKRNTLSIIRESEPGLYLDGGELGEILLPGRYIPANLAQGQKLDVFVYRDSMDRLVATTETPHAMVGEFASLRVVSVHPQMGVFLDWGLQKDLLLPFREHEQQLRVGDRVVVVLFVDPKTHRIVATTRYHRHLSKLPPPYREGHPVTFILTDWSPLGYGAIVEHAHRGLLYHNNLRSPLSIGQTVRGFVVKVRPGGKIDLSLDAAGYGRVRPLTELILEALAGNQGRLAFDDDSSPESIREEFGVSKKAFKQALGALYKQGRIQFSRPGIEIPKDNSWRPGGTRD
ncbi:MAG TPA: GntR family transcriptional regulator [Verrucomicrobiales bacterium]|nr:GntR family transcriptional regulator [Verrucomicrobiales bacterium]